jgi:Na+-translocating ferredoxin:NAD+ oxidoreductase RnfG subunit
MYLNVTSNKMKFGIAMMLIASLSAALLTIPSKVAADQTMQGMSDNKTKITKAVITQLRSNHPMLAAIADKVQTMDAKETLKNLIGVEILSDLLTLHAKGLIVNQTAGNQTTGQ